LTHGCRSSERSPIWIFAEGSGGRSNRGWLVYGLQIGKPFAEFDTGTAQIRGAVLPPT